MFLTPFRAAELTLETGVMIAEAQAVIAMRLWGMAGLWNTAPEESLRMVQEKAEAALQSTLAAGRAVMNGNDSTAVALAALKPVRHHTRANMKRLSARGPAVYKG